MSKRNITHLRWLYILFAGILLSCVALTVAGVVGTDEDPQLGGLSTPESPYAFTVTDLQTVGTLQGTEQAIDSVRPTMQAHAHIERFSMDFYTKDESITSDPRIRWVMALQAVVMVALAAIVALVAVLLVSLYRSTKQGRVFPTRNSTLMLAVGVLMLVISLCHDLSTYLERTLARDLLAGTQWQPQAHYSVHFTLIFFGLTLVFLSQLFRIGRELQEENELTI